MKIEEIDKNFKVQTSLGCDNTKFYDIEEKPFRIYGIFRDGDRFARMPFDAAEKVSKGVLGLAGNTAGGRVRFSTDSEYISVKAEMGAVNRMSHMAMTGIAGFDAFELIGGEYIFLGTFIPPFLGEDNERFEAVIRFDEKRMRDITINFPLYAEVRKVFVGLNAASEVGEGKRYRNEKPIVYYGSSITQGGCASKPGSSYQSIISQKTDLDYINLGFSGSAKGETKMARYISGLDMSIFVYDYDHNADNKEFLKKTHKKFFDIIRKKQPDLPIIIISSPKFRQNNEWRDRKGVIEETYLTAKKNGDKNVYFIDGMEFMSDYVMHNWTVDNSHPTDAGFFCMARRIETEVNKIVKGLCSEKGK